MRNSISGAAAIRAYTMHVYPHADRDGSVSICSYTSTQGRPGCIHEVSAPDWRRASRAAEQEHRRQCLPVAKRVVTHPDGHNAYPSPGRTSERRPCDCPPTILPVPIERRLP